MRAIKYTGADADRRGPSTKIWSDCPVEAIIAGSEDGIHFFDDFVATEFQATQTTELAWGQYKMFSDAAKIWHSALTVNSVAIGGGILGGGVDTDDDSAAIALESQSFRMSGVPATDKKLWFEARIAVSPITTHGIGFILGLAETSLFTLAAAVPLNASDALTADGAFIGFQYLEDDLATCSSAYSDRSAAAATEIGSNEVTLAAFTFTKLGFVYDPNDSVNTIRFYQDGVQLATVMSAATLVALTNLDANLLGPILAIIADASGTSGLIYMDWWKVAQLQ